MQPFPISSIKGSSQGIMDEISRGARAIVGRFAEVSLFFSEIHVNLGLDMFFQCPLQGMFLLGTLLAPSQLVLVFPSPSMHTQKGQYTNAMHMHLHAFHTHTHTHTQCTHDMHMHVCVDCI